MNSYKDLYLKTAGEHLRIVANSILTLKKTSNDKNSLELLHRGFHSLKSQSLIMGYTSLGELAKTLELFFKQIIETKNIISVEQLNIIEQTIQRMQKSLDQIKEHNKEIDLTTEIKSLDIIFSMQSVMTKLNSLVISNTYEGTSR